MNSRNNLKDEEELVELPIFGKILAIKEAQVVSFKCNKQNKIKLSLGFFLGKLKSSWMKWETEEQVPSAI